MSELEMQRILNVIGWCAGINLAMLTLGGIMLDVKLSAILKAIRETPHDDK